MSKLNHQNISFIKSGFRIVAGLMLITGHLAISGGLFIAAEALGILEEVV